MGQCKDQKDLLVEMLTLPTQQVPIHVHLSLHNGNEWHHVLELSNAVLPLEEKLQGSLTLLLQFLIDNRRISPCQKPGVINKEAFNSLVVHKTSLG